jgi:hypothetical protein
VRDGEGKTPSELGSQRGHHEMVQLLSDYASGKVSLLCLFYFVFLLSFCTFTFTFCTLCIMSFESKPTGLLKDKKDMEKTWKSTDTFPDVMPRL